MANQEHLAILKQGVEVWNQWKDEHKDIRPDLCRTDLRKVTLRKADLSEADLFDTTLSDADLSHANLFNTDLRYANLCGTHLSHAHLINTDLSHAHLINADLSHAHLIGTHRKHADLSHAHLIGTHLSRANFFSTDLQKAELGWTTFEDINLSQTKGLESVSHRGPSYIDIRTIYLSGGNIPEVFLRKAGVPDSFIEYMRSLVGKPIDYYSCFISYSSKDQDFAKRLYADFQSNGVRCWFALHHLRPGTVILRGIDEAIQMYDKLLLILSQASVTSNWVEHEVEMALFKEMERKSDVLFPIRLDNTVLESPTAWAARLRHRHIGDFTLWKQHDDYQQAFTRLLRDLKAEGQKQIDDEAAKDSHE